MNGSLIVVGGGAAGMLAALTARQAGAEVTLIERNPKLGRKVYITGKGRCNLTNHCTVEEALAHIPRNGKFLYSAMSAFPPSATEALFEGLGVPLKVERGNRVFPVSDKASDVIDALFAALRRAGVSIVEGRVTELELAKAHVTAVRTDVGRFPAGAVILATGGLSYPATGSTGDGYALAQSVGHTVVEPRGSLVPLEAEGCAPLQGLSLKNVALSVTGKKPKPLFKEQGELLFTHFGLSGPLVLSASAHLRHYERETYTAHIDLKPALSVEQLEARMVRDLADYANRDLSNYILTLTPHLLGPVLLARAGVAGSSKLHSLTREARRALSCVFKDLTFPITAPRPVAEAIVTTGGVNVKEVDPKTMASKLCEGLYLAGELLDVDGYTGGFNLQIAWCTGRAAGNAAAAYLRGGNSQ